MIAKITGTVQEILQGSIIVDVAGVGYEIIITSREQDFVNVGEEQSFYIAENIKEDEHSLYGFFEIESRNIYYQLTSVNGVGPKAAMAILNTHTANEITSAVMSENISLFSAVSGVGKKTAQRIILDLKGKLVTEIDLEDDLSSDAAYQALLSLGYKNADAKKALANISKDQAVADRVKQALAGGSK